MSTEARIYHKVDQAGNPVTQIGNRVFSYPVIWRLFDDLEEIVTWMPEGKRYILISNPLGLRKLKVGHQMDLTAYTHCLSHPDTRNWVTKFFRKWWEFNRAYKANWFFYFGHLRDWEKESPLMKQRIMKSISPFIRMPNIELGFDAMSSHKRPPFSRVWCKWLTNKSDNIYIEALPDLAEADDWKDSNGVINTDWYFNPARHGNDKMDLQHYTANDRRLILMCHQDIKKLPLATRITKIKGWLQQGYSTAFSLKWAINAGKSYEDMFAQPSSSSSSTGGEGGVPDPSSTTGPSS
tara:strand:- start:2404 stop:3285 length:882 start_codon:yes stop_codon:yes gene_type:complete